MHRDQTRRGIPSFVFDRSRRRRYSRGSVGSLPANRSPSADGRSPSDADTDVKSGASEVGAADRLKPPPVPGSARVTQPLTAKATPTVARERTTTPPSKTVVPPPAATPPVAAPPKRERSTTPVVYASEPPPRFKSSAIDS